MPQAGNTADAKRQDSGAPGGGQAVDQPPYNRTAS